MFVLNPNTAFIIGQEETVDLTNVKITIYETYIKIGDVILNNVSDPRRRVISPTEEEWAITTIVKLPAYFQAVPKKVIVKVRKKGSEILFIQFNDQVFTTKIYYSQNALPIKTEGDNSEYHTVIYGENLGRIGRKYQKSMEELYALNPGMNKNIRPGQKIKVK